MNFDILGEKNNPSSLDSSRTYNLPIRSTSGALLLSYIKPKVNQAV